MKSLKSIGSSSRLLYKASSTPANNTYKNIHTGPNTQSGGRKLGLASCSYHAVVPLPEIAPEKVPSPIQINIDKPNCLFLVIIVLDKKTNF